MIVAHIQRAYGFVSAAALAIVVVLTRLTLGQAFMQAGWGKLNAIERTTGFFQDQGIPFPHANTIFIGSLELVGGALLIVGLVLRPVATLLLATMVVAILTAHRADFLSALALNPEKGLTDLTPWMFGLLLLWLIGNGAGALSLDRLIAARKSKPLAPR